MAPWLRRPAAGVSVAELCDGATGWAAVPVSRCVVPAGLGRCSGLGQLEGCTEGWVCGQVEGS
jgi:hypothetical protein